MAFSSVAHLARRGDVFYFRRAIPKALVPVFGRRELKLSLGTDERHTARMRCRDMANAFERMLGEVSGMAALTQEQIEALLRAYFTRQWAVAQEAVHYSSDKHDRELDPAHEAACAKEEANTLRQRAIAHQYDNAIRADARELLDQHGHGAKAVDLEKLDTICNGILRAQAEQRRIFAAMLEGRFAETVPSDPLFAGMKAPGLPPTDGDQLPKADAPAGEPLSAIFEAWKAEKKPPAKLVMEFGKGIRRFMELHGDVPAITISKAMIREFKAALQKLPAVRSGTQRNMKLQELLKALEKEPANKTLSVGSINKDLGSLSAVLAWAGKQGYFEANPMWSNPVSGMKLEGGPDAEEERVCYDPADLKTIFTSPVYSEGARPRAAGGDAAKWLPLLGLFTGARLEELGQALVSDIRQEDGVVFLAITTEGGGKSLKTKTSRRVVPLHPWLIRLGFLAYVGERQKAGDTHLFPDLKPDQFSKRTGNWSKWWGRYVRDIGITDSRKVFHSFRHGFKAACRAAEIEEEVHDAITGHAGGGVGRRYGRQTSIPLKVLNNAVGRVTFNVSLEHLLPPPQSTTDQQSNSCGS